MSVTATPLQSQSHCAEFSLAAARRGDPDAFTTLVSPHAPRLKRLARRFTRTAEDAEDICQESLLKAFTKLDQFSGSQLQRDEFRAWLMRITANCAIDFIRRQKAYKLVPLEECDTVPKLHAVGADGWSDSPETHCTRQEQFQMIAGAMAKLSPELRNVCLLRNLLELSTKEVAAQLGISPLAVRMRLFRAHTQLRKILSRRPWPRTRQRIA
jgi:RNA polymerase sigma-70 factor, ECF subfamily